MDMQPSALLEDHSHPGAPAGATPTALACVLEYAAGAQIALPIHAGVELVEQPRIVPVPGMPHFCLGLLAWQGRQLPLIDFQVYLQEPGTTPAARACGHVLVVAYQTAPAQPIEYGALCAPFLIRMIEVADHQQCPLPAGQPRWTDIAISCLMNQGQAVPVLDLARVFGRSVSSGTN